MRFLVDTNILTYAVNRDCDEHRAAVRAMDRWPTGGEPWAVTWGVIYEFLRVATHPRIFRAPARG